MADALGEGFDTRWTTSAVARRDAPRAMSTDTMRQHATAHFRATQHPVMRSVMPGDTWAWCYVHGVQAELSPAPPERLGAAR